MRSGGASHHCRDQTAIRLRASDLALEIDSALCDYILAHESRTDLDRLELNTRKEYVEDLRSTLARAADGSSVEDREAAMEAVKQHQSAAQPSIYSSVASILSEDAQAGRH